MQRVSQSPTEDTFVQDPYPFYDQVREAGALVYWEDYEMPVAAGYETVSALLRDRRFGRECPAELVKPVPARLAPFYDVERHSMLELEPPRHTRLRGHVLRAFTTRQISSLGPQIAALSHELIDNFPPNEPFDLLTAFAQPLPVRVIARLLGVPEEASDDLLRWSKAMVAMYQASRSRDVEDRAVQATQDFVSFLRSYIEERRKTPSKDLISTLIQTRDDGDSLSTEELISNLILLLNAGHEATVHTLGNAVKTLLETGIRPEDSAAFREEVLRHDPPLHLFTRYALEDIDFGGHRFKRGDQVGLLLAAANRDPSVFDTPAKFIPDREAQPHVSLGAGLHFCVGAPLARLEIQIGLAALFERCGDLRLTAEPRYRDIYHFHGLEALMVTTTPRAR